MANATILKKPLAAKAKGGLQPRGEDLHRVNTVLPVPIYMRLLAEAKAARRSVAQQFAYVIEKHLNERGVQ